MSPTLAPSLTISSPDTFISAVPHLLGFMPEDSVVIAGIGRGPQGRDVITLVQRFDLPSTDLDAGQLREIARAATSPMARVGSHEVIITVLSDKAYASPDELPHRELVDQLIEAHDEAGISTRDSLYSDGTSRWSYGCVDPDCCPPTGRVIPQDVRTLVAAEFTAAGVAVASSRDDLAAELAPADPAQVRAVAEQLESMKDPGAAIETWRDQQIDHIHQVLASGSPLDAQACAEVIDGLDDVRVRDTVLWDLAQGRGDGTLVTARLADVVRNAPEGRIAPAATVLSVQHWTAGDGTRANFALDRALADNPDYSLGGLVKTSLSSGLPPSTWRELICSMPRQTCRHGSNPTPGLVREPVLTPVHAPGLAS